MKFLIFLWFLGAARRRRPSRGLRSGISAATCRTTSSSPITSRRSSPRVYAGDGRLLAEYATEKRVFVPVKRDAAARRSAFLAAEDQQFLFPSRRRLRCRCCAPRSTDISRIGSNRRPDGASTITQQVARNFLLNNEVSLERKIKEALLAMQDGARAEQGAHPRALSQRDLSRRRRLWRRRGGAHLLQQVARPARGRARRPSWRRCRRRPTTTIRRAIPRRRSDAARLGDRPHGRGGLHHAGAGARRRRPSRSQSAGATRRDRRPPYFAEEVRRELLARYGDKPLYEGGLVGAHEPRPHAPGGAEQGAARRADRL